jgi:hypothetical protein
MTGNWTPIVENWLILDEKAMKYHRNHCFACVVWHKVNATQMVQLTICAKTEAEWETEWLRS